MIKLTTGLKNWLIQHMNVAPSSDEEAFRRAASEAVKGGTLSSEKLAELVGSTTPSPETVFSRIRMKGGSEQYSTTKSTGKHAKTGESILWRGKPAELPSQQETAKLGVFFKHQARRSGVNVAWTDHDQALWDELTSKDAWIGQAGAEDIELRGGAVKALLNDAVSGASYLIPALLDDVLVTRLLLTSELLPYVDLKDVPRGRVIDTLSMGQVSIAWGVPEGTPIPLFDTTNLFARVSTTIYPVVVALEVGRDFLSDSPLDVGTELETSIANKYKEELDRVICLGDGATQPLGIFSSPAGTIIPSVNGAPGPVTIADAENLIFGVPKQYRSGGVNPSWVGNDVNYRRFRTIREMTDSNLPIGGTGYSDYRVLNYPYRVNNSIPNSEVAFLNLKSYRLFRRQGAESEFTTEGKDLRLRNMALLTFRARYGGRVMDSAGEVLMVDLPA
jgi:HK97 family phage major capsid protein